MTISTTAPPSGGPQRPLVVRFGAIGDVIQLTSMLAHLYGLWGRPVEVVAGTGAAAVVLRHLPEAGRVIVGGSRRTPYWLHPIHWSIARRLRRAAIGPVWIIDHDPRATRNLRRLLTGSGVDPSAVVDSLELPRGPLEHTLDYHHRLAAIRRPGWPKAVAAAPAAPPPARLVTTAEEVDDCRRWLDRRRLSEHPVVVVQTSSRKRKRGRWPRERWRECLRRILDAMPDARVVLAGIPAERDGIRSLALACADPRIVEAAEDLPLRRMFALLTLAHSCISLDTGPAHAAAALGCPLVVITGMADPRRCAPLAGAAPVEVVSVLPRSDWPDNPYDWQRLNRMERIGVDQVFAAWMGLAGRSPDGACTAGGSADAAES